jgi:hypothetical protein
VWGSPQAAAAAAAAATKHKWTKLKCITESCRLPSGDETSGSRAAGAVAAALSGFGEGRLHVGCAHVAARPGSAAAAAAAVAGEASSAVAARDDTVTTSRWQRGSQRQLPSVTVTISTHIARAASFLRRRAHARTHARTHTHTHTHTLEGGFIPAKCLPAWRRRIVSPLTCLRPTHQL